MTQEMATREPQALAYRHELTVDELAAQVDKIHAVMAKLMKPEVHYGTIPGTKKPTPGIGGIARGNRGTSKPK